MRDGWLHQMTDEDITRILARYKEHVSFWNVGIEVIRAELQTLADALGRGFYDLASRFDAQPPKRVPPELVYTFARVRKDVFEPFQPTAPQPYTVTPQPSPHVMGRWVPANFTSEEVSRLQQSLSSVFPPALVQVSALQVSALAPSFCELRGAFARADLERALHDLQPTESLFQGTTIQYEIVWVS